MSHQSQVKSTIFPGAAGRKGSPRPIRYGLSQSRLRALPATPLQKIARVFGNFMDKHRKHVTILVAILMFVIAAVGFVLPILPGVVFLFIGVYLLSLHSQWFERRMMALRRKYPRAAKRFEKFERKLALWFKNEVTLDKE